MFMYKDQIYSFNWFYSYRHQLFTVNKQILGFLFGCERINKVDTAVYFYLFYRDSQLICKLLTVKS